ncbi:MAG: hypothetical protein V1870_03675 [Candidatus Aenigmatarchaeota archaeon]
MTDLMIDKYAMCQADLCIRDAKYLLGWYSLPESIGIKNNGLVSQTYSCQNQAHLEEIYYYSHWLNRKHPDIIINIETKNKEKEIMKHMKTISDKQPPTSESMPVFKTEKGSLYYVKSNGFWIRQKYNGEIFNGSLYIGSVNPDQNPLYRENSKDNSNKQLTKLIKEICSGEIPGFYPFFVIGNHSLGIKGYGKDEIIMTDQHRIMYSTSAFPIPHIGHVITKLF